MDSRLGLKPGAIVTVHGRVYRVAERHLDPNRKPGLGRVSYTVERGLLRPDGTYSFGAFVPDTFPASIVEPEAP